ncbi:hypothetical protein BH18THE2_BH18THE2_04110 [soil metagenome]
MPGFKLESESIKSGFQHKKTMNNRSIVRMELGLVTAFGLLLIAIAPSTIAFAQDTAEMANETAGNMTAMTSEGASNMTGMANETAGNMTDGGNQSEGGNPLSEIPIIGDLLTGGK